MRLLELHRPGMPQRRSSAQDAQLATGPSGRWILDAEQERALHVLEAAAEEPVTPADLREAGVRHPAQTMYELALAGYDIERPRRRHASPAERGYRLGASAPPVARR